MGPAGVPGEGVPVLLALRQGEHPPVADELSTDMAHHHHQEQDKCRWHHLAPTGSSTATTFPQGSQRRHPGVEWSPPGRVPRTEPLRSLHSAWQVGRQQKSTSRSGRSQSCVRGAEWVAAAPGAVWRGAPDGWDASRLQHKLDCTTSLLIFPLHPLNHTASTRPIQSYLSTRY